MARNSRGDFATQVAKQLETYSRPEELRDYVGASILGTNCERVLRYVHERVRPTPPYAKSLRIFEFGDAIETLVVHWLKACFTPLGFHVYDRNPLTGDQFRCMSEKDGMRIGGHADGLLSAQSLLPDLWEAMPLHERLTPEFVRLIEVKSHKNDRFEEVRDLGVQESKFEHYAQVQKYMRDSKQLTSAFGLPVQLTQCLYVAVNKDTCEIYTEDIAFDDDTAERLESRARRAVSAPTLTPRLSSDPKKGPCKWCDYAVHCYADERAVKAPLGVGDAGRHGRTLHDASSDRVAVRGSERRLSDVEARREATARGGASWRD